MMDQTTFYDSSISDHSLLISVILPTNRCDRYFDLALTSIENQTYKNLEIIVVANGVSEYQYQKILKRAADPRIKILKTDFFGLTFSLNYGINAATSEYIVRMDADDISHPQRIEVQYNFLKSHPKVAVCGSAYYLIDEGGARIGLIKLPEGDISIKKWLRWRNPICHPSVMCKRSVITASGGYSGVHSEDYELWLKLMDNKAIQFHNLQAPLLDYRAPIFGNARRSKMAYAQASGFLFTKFIKTLNFIWLLSSIIFLLKALLRSKQP